MLKSIFLSLAFAAAASTVSAAETLKIAVTTSFHNSGLAEALLPQLASATEMDLTEAAMGPMSLLSLVEIVPGLREGASVHSDIALA